jgi:hypothetical protein
MKLHQAASHKAKEDTRMNRWELSKDYRATLPQDYYELNRRAAGSFAGDLNTVVFYAEQKARRTAGHEVLRLLGLR